MTHIGAERIISGPQATEETLAWAKGNITSITEAVQKGRHSSVYYPACGRDALRVALAYDANVVTAVDTAPELFLETEAQVFGLDAEASVDEISDYEHRILFTYGGKQRRIDLTLGDARKVAVPAEPVDVLHIYLPTGADQDIPGADDTEGQEVAFHKIENKLTGTNYQQVSEGGFFVFEERRLTYRQTELPQVLLAVAGLSEHAITRRHPYNVMTTLHSSTSEVAAMDRTGYIYRKERTVSPEIVEVFNQGIGVIDSMTYEMDVVGRLDLIELNPSDNPEFDINEHLREISTEYQKSVADVVKGLKGSGATDDSLNALKQEMDELLLQASERLKQNLQAFLQLYNQMADESVTREISGAEAIERFGIEHDPIYGTWMSKQWPFASSILFGDDEARAKLLDTLTTLLDIL